jgi:hypothetical protein
MNKSLWPQVEVLAGRLLELVREHSPKGEMEIRTAHAHILGMFWRSFRLYEGVLLLLRAELPEEAAFLARTLFECSLRLRQMASEPDRRDGLILWWVNRSIDEKAGLLGVAKEVGLDQNIDEALKSLAEERKVLQEYLRRNGVAKLLSFRSVKDSAFRYDRKEDYWMYEWAHDSVHANDVAWMFARKKIAHDSVGLYAKTNDPLLLASWAGFAATSLTAATKATAEIFGWHLPSEFGEPAKEIERLLDTEAG